MILRRYIQTEIAEKLGWILGLLLLILSADRLVDYLAAAAAGQLPGELLLQMLLMRMLSSLPKLLPIAVFIAVFLGLSRLVRDKELLIIQGAGLAIRFQLLSVMQFVLAFAVLVVIVGFYIAPWAERNLDQLKARARAEADAAGMGSGQFKEFNSGERTLYVERLSADDARMRNVFLQAQQGNRPGVLHARTAGYEFAHGSGSRYIRFEDGRRYLGAPGELDYQITDYRAYAVLLDAGAAVVAAAKSGGKLEGLPSAGLLGSSNPQHTAELQWRISLVLSAALLPVLALALSRYPLAEQRYLPLFLCIAIYMIYGNLLSISKTLLGRGQLPPYLGLWWVHGLLILISLLLFYLPQARKLFLRTL